MNEIKKRVNRKSRRKSTGRRKYLVRPIVTPQELEAKLAELGISVPFLAERSGLSKQTIYNFLDKACPPRRTSLLLINAAIRKMERQQAADKKGGE